MVPERAFSVPDSRDRAGVGEGILGDAVQCGVDAQGERVGGRLPERNVGVLDDENELSSAGRRRRPAEGG
jgi:hypothetical protein